MRRFGLVVMVICGCTGSKTSETPFELIGRDWTVPTGTETYRCIGVQADRDMFIHDFETLNPLGEHHAVLTVSDTLDGFNNTQLGEYDCSVGTNELQMIFGSGVGTTGLTLPEGIAVPIKKGQYLFLNLHLFNMTDSEITAHSGIIATPAGSVDTAHSAELVFTGTFNINVPPGQTATTSGGCVFTKDATIFSFFPHMHMHGTHAKLTLTQGGVPNVLYDTDYNFREQQYVALTPTLSVHAGDSIQADCTYNNTTATTLTFGDSSTAEMCFTGLYRFPKQEISLFDCTEGHM